MLARRHRGGGIFPCAEGARLRSHELDGIPALAYGFSMAGCVPCMCPGSPLARSGLVSRHPRAVLCGCLVLVPARTLAVPALVVGLALEGEPLLSTRGRSRCRIGISPTRSPKDSVTEILHLRFVVLRSGASAFAQGSFGGTT